MLAGWQRIRQPIKKKQNEAIKQTRIFGHHESSGTSILGCAKWLVPRFRVSPEGSLGLPGRLGGIEKQWYPKPETNGTPLYHGIDKSRPPKRIGKSDPKTLVIIPMDGNRSAAGPQKSPKTPAWPPLGNSTLEPHNRAELYYGVL